MPFEALVSLDRIRATCERIYLRDGFVKWSDVATEHGLSRQAIQARLKKAVATGQIPPEDVDRWMSTSARLRVSRLNEHARRQNEKLNIRVTLTPENFEWIQAQCKARGLRSGDIINGLITKARN